LEFEDLRDLLAALETESRHRGIPSIYREDGVALAALAFAAPRGGLVLDLGAGIGYSTAWLALGAGAWGGRVVAVEADPGRARVLRGYAPAIEEYTGARVEVVEGDALEFLEGLPEGSVSAAFVDVEKSLYRRVLEALAGKAVPGALAAFHNAYFPRPPGEFFEAAARLESVIVPTPVGLLIARLR